MPAVRGIVVVLCEKVVDGETATQLVAGQVRVGLSSMRRSWR